jgi:hypothetical protein
MGIPRSRRAPAGAQYRIGLNAATLAGVTGAQYGTLSSAVFSFQWYSTVTAATSGSALNMYPKLCMVTQVECSWQIVTTFTAAQTLTFGLFRVATFTTAATSGGYQATFTVNSGRFDSQYGTTTFASTGGIWMSSATALVGAVGTIDTYPMRYFTGLVNTQGVGVASPFVPFAMGNDPNSQALFLRQNEGFVIQCIDTLGAGGILDFFVNVEWIEMSNELT